MKTMSEQISCYDGGDYHVTAAIWRAVSDRGDIETFEIGIRTKSTGQFVLIQGDFDWQSVQEVANAIAGLLADKTQCYTPEWCKDHFR